MVWFHGYLERREALEKTARYPLAAGRQRPLPPPPRLQTYPFDDIKDMRADQRRLLDRYEWVDRRNGIVRIPVERAMDLIAERGLPHRATAPAATPEAVPDAQPDAARSPAEAPAAAAKH
jgi:hypothetical protein